MPSKSKNNAVNTSNSVQRFNFISDNYNSRQSRNEEIRLVSLSEFVLKLVKRRKTANIDKSAPSYVVMKMDIEGTKGLGS